MFLENLIFEVSIGVPIIASRLWSIVDDLNIARSSGINLPSLNMSGQQDELVMFANYACKVSMFVAGMTQAIIPTLVEKGIDAVSVGVNPGTSPPAVPNLFVWRFEEQEVLATWHPGKIFIVLKKKFLSVCIIKCIMDTGSAYTDNKNH